MSLRGLSLLPGAAPSTSGSTSVPAEVPTLVGRGEALLEGVCRIRALGQGPWPAWEGRALPGGGGLCFAVHCLFRLDSQFPL